MGIVSSIKDFIGGEPEFDEFDGYNDEAEFEDDVVESRRGFTRFSMRREPQEAYIPENDITIIKVRKYDDAVSIADVLKTKRPVIFDVIEMEKSDEAERVVDFMVGAVYGVNGSIRRVSGGIFIATPSGMKINSDEIRKKTNNSLGFEL